MSSTATARPALTADDVAWKFFQGGREGQWLSFRQTQWLMETDVRERERAGVTPSSRWAYGALTDPRTNTYVGSWDIKVQRNGCAVFQVKRWDEVAEAVKLREAVKNTIAARVNDSLDVVLDSLGYGGEVRPEDRPWLVARVDARRALVDFAKSILDRYSYNDINGSGVDAIADQIELLWFDRDDL